MKRIGDLYSKISTKENIYEAALLASVNKHQYVEVVEFWKNKEHNLNLLYGMLQDKTFVCAEYERFTKWTSGKEREIFKLPFFPDRIIQHAILKILEPIWRGTLITDTFQAIRGRGVHQCFFKVKKVIQVQKQMYCLQLDIKKFYASIDNEILKDTLTKKIKCKDTLNLIYAIIDGHQGVPIGNYTSQYLGNLYLNELDHLLKEKYRAKFYYRYCDDIIILHNDKNFLWGMFNIIVEWLQIHKLCLKDNFQLYQINNDRGVDCLGFVIYPDRIKLRKSIAERFKSRTLDIGNYSNEVLAAYFGWFLHCDADKYWLKYTTTLKERLIEQDAVLNSNRIDFINKLTSKLKQKKGLNYGKSSFRKCGKG